jgi:hypothetical protein
LAVDKTAQPDEEEDEGGCDSEGRDYSKTETLVVEECV